MKEKKAFLLQSKHTVVPPPRGIAKCMQPASPPASRHHRDRFDLHLHGYLLVPSHHSISVQAADSRDLIVYGKLGPVQVANQKHYQLSVKLEVVH